MPPILPERTPIVAFVRTRDPGGWMSNMSPYPVQYRGHTCRTAEHLFQVLRIDPDLRHPAVGEVLAQASPMAAKFRFKALVRDGLSLAVTQWSPEDVENMRLVVGLKLDQHPMLQASLAATGTGTLVEDTTNRGRPDTFWGARRIVPGDDTPTMLRSWIATDRTLWLGENKLGKIWMQERNLRRLL